MRDRFLFHGQASAFGARLRRPARLDARASVCIPSIGGRASGGASGYSLDDIVRFDVAGSEVVGEEVGDRLRVTRATSWVRGLEVPGVLAVKRLRATLSSRYEVPSRKASFPSLDIEMEGLTIKGSEVRCDEAILARVKRTPSFDAFAQAFDNEADRARLVVSTEPPAPSGGAGPPLPLSKARAISCFTLQPPREVERHGGTVVDGGFSVVSGRTRFHVFFGECIVSAGQRRLTLIRIEMEPATPGGGSHRASANAAPRAMSNGPLPPSPSRPSDRDEAPDDGETPEAVEGSVACVDVEINGSLFP